MVTVVIFYIFILNINCTKNQLIAFMKSTSFFLFTISVATQVLYSETNED